MRTILIFFLAWSSVMDKSLAETASNNQTSALPSKQFRSEHVEIKKHLSHIEQMVDGLYKEKSKDPKKTMLSVVNFFKEHIEPHAAWEEKKLYPAVDKRAGKSSEVFTASMRYEHKIVGRWIAALEKEAGSASPNAKAFARKTDQLLGLIFAHFEEEEEVLLPILDKSMTAEEFKKEILSEGHH